MQVLNDVTKLLPDDTWITQLEVKSAPKGKEPRRELMLRGESANAGRLVSLLEESKVFVDAAPRSPTTKIQPGPGEIFDLGAQVAPMPSPLPLQLASTPVEPATPAVVAPEAPAVAAPATPPATPPATAAAPVVPPTAASHRRASSRHPDAPALQRRLRRPCSDRRLRRPRSRRG